MTSVKLDSNVVVGRLPSLPPTLGGYAYPEAPTLRLQPPFLLEIGPTGVNVEAGRHTLRTWAPVVLAKRLGQPVIREGWEFNAKCENTCLMSSMRCPSILPSFLH